MADYSAVSSGMCGLTVQHGACTGRAEIPGPYDQWDVCVCTLRGPSPSAARRRLRGTNARAAWRRFGSNSVWSCDAVASPAPVLCARQGGVALPAWCHAVAAGMPGVASRLAALCAHDWRHAFVLRCLLTEI